jgi:outer membrane lipoprotein SlyB
MRRNMLSSRPGGGWPGDHQSNYLEMDSMKRQFLCTLALLSFTTLCAASNEPAVPISEAAKKEAANRYSEDQKICADESTSSRRMQCLRDARDEYNRATGSTDVKPAADVRPATELRPAAASAPPPPVCNDCGRVTAVRVVEQEGKTGVGGMIAGGVVGGLLGRQVGKGRGKDVATIAGAAGGAYAGNRIEGNMNKSKTWVVTVHFDNGGERSFSYDNDPGYAAGDPVRASGSGLVRR